MTWCCSNLAMFHTMRGDFQAAEEVIEKGLSLARENGFALYEVGILSFRIIGKAAQGDFEDIQRAARQARKSAGGDYELARTWARSAVAEALIRAGQIDDALNLLKQAAALSERNHERYVDPELSRIMGELAARQSEAEGNWGKVAEGYRVSAERLFREAIDKARAGGAKIFELRATISLGRLLLKSGRPQEARDLLHELFDRFTEGFETRELKQAAALLDQFGAMSVQ